MIYSVPTSGGYDYYEGHAQEPSKPAHLHNTTKIGAVYLDAAWPLPANAQHVGRGADAKGMIARAPGAVAAVGDWDGGSTTTKFLFLAGAIWLLSKVRYG